MAFKAKFSVDGKEVNVLTCSFSFHQNVDPTGRPSSDVRGGMIHVSVESTEDTSMFEWMTDPHGFKSGKIIFYKRDSDSKMKELEFKDASCVEYNESFDAVSASPMYTSFTLSAREVTIGNATHANQWPI